MAKGYRWEAFGMDHARRYFGPGATALIGTAVSVSGLHSPLLASLCIGVAVLWAALLFFSGWLGKRQRPESAPPSQAPTRMADPAAVSLPPLDLASDLLVDFENIGVTPLDLYMTQSRPWSIIYTDHVRLSNRSFDHDLALSVDLEYRYTNGDLAPRSSMDSLKQEIPIWQRMGPVDRLRGFVEQRETEPIKLAPRATRKVKLCWVPMMKTVEAGQWTETVDSLSYTLVITDHLSGQTKRVGLKGATP